MGAGGGPVGSPTYQCPARQPSFAKARRNPSAPRASSHGEPCTAITIPAANTAAIANQVNNTNNSFMAGRVAADKLDASSIPAQLDS